MDRAVHDYLTHLANLSELNRFLIDVKYDSWLYFSRRGSVRWTSVRLDVDECWHVMRQWRLLSDLFRERLNAYPYTVELNFEELFPVGGPRVPARVEQTLSEVLGFELSLDDLPSRPTRVDPASLTLARDAIHFTLPVVVQSATKMSSDPAFLDQIQAVRQSS